LGEPNIYDDPNSIDEYSYIKIGRQIWMAENLKVSEFRNGDLIPEAKTDEAWEQAGIECKPAWCYYNNNQVNRGKYGKLYNWHAVNDPRGLAPEGWYIPSDDDWNELEMALGMSQGDADMEGERGTNEGSKLKASEGWEEGGGINSSGFSALPGGYRYINGSF
jgi:uncharacterized protein (TIGR02145 family)